MKTAIQFGVENIGYGFMGQLFFEAGYQTIFIETDRADDVKCWAEDNVGFVGTSVARMVPEISAELRQQVSLANFMDSRISIASHTNNGLRYRKAR